MIMLSTFSEARFHIALAFSCTDRTYYSFLVLVIYTNFGTQVAMRDAFVHMGLSKSLFMSLTLDCSIHFIELNVVVRIYSMKRYR